MQYTKASLRKRRQDALLLWHSPRDTLELLVTIVTLINTCLPCPSHFLLAVLAAVHVQLKTFPQSPHQPRPFLHVFPHVNKDLRPLATMNLRIRKNLGQVLICAQSHIFCPNQHIVVVTPLLLIDLITMTRNSLRLSRPQS